MSRSVQTFDWYCILCYSNRIYCAIRMVIKVTVVIWLAAMQNSMTITARVCVGRGIRHHTLITLADNINLSRISRLWMDMTFHPPVMSI